MKKFKNLFIFLLISYQLIIGQALNAAGFVPPTNEERDINDIDNLMKNADPSDIPFIDYVESFQIEHTQPIKEHDLSEFIGKQIYIGYGIYDGDNKYCKFTETTIPPSVAVDVRFRDIQTFNGHSYGLVRDGDMNYQACVNIASEYGGIVATPTTASENSFLRSYSVSNWLGMTKTTCDDEYYLNMNQAKQEYTNFNSTDDSDDCDITKLNVVQDMGSSWSKVNSNDVYNCIVEVNSPDFKRPIKICAPWWRVERKYTKPENYNVGGINLLTVNKADIPELYNICTQLNENGIEDASSEIKQEFHCTTYYDATRKPECLTNPYQPQCKVSECQGYVEEACTHKDTVIPLKDYTKITANINGVDTQIKGKVDIRTQIYDCPVITPSSSDCLEMSTVIAYPMECPNSDCNRKTECYSEATNSDEQLACNAAYRCEKIYPNTSITPVASDLDTDGNVQLLHAKCEDGTILDFPVNVQNKLNRTCVEYSTLTETKEITKDCTLERDYQEFSIDMSITGVDDYENDPDCIRVNNILDARPIEDVIFDAEGFGFAENYVNKAYLDGKLENVLFTSNSSYTIGMATIPPDDQSQTGDITQTTVPLGSIGNTSCELAESGTEATIESWHTNKLVPVMDRNGKISYTGGTNAITTIPVIAAAECSSVASTIGGTVTATSPCTISRTATNQDKIFFEIQGLGEFGDPADPDMAIKYTSYNTTMTTAQCLDWAECLDAAGTLSGGRCVATHDANTPDISEGTQTVTSITDEVNSCSPPSYADTNTTTFNGTRDIFYIEDVVQGVFGYSSNYLGHPYKDNVVVLNGKEAFPITRVPSIIDELDYMSIIKQRSILTKKPNYVAGAIAGSAAGAGYALYTTALSVPVLGVIIVVVAVIVALLFAKKVKLNEESIYWLLYKDIQKGDYMINVYDYDKRIRTDLSSSIYRLKYAIGGEEPTGTLTSGSNWWKSFTGTHKPGDFVKFLQNMFKIKQQNFACTGFDPNVTPSTPMELRVVVPYPKCKWYEFSCDKRNDGLDNTTSYPGTDDIPTNQRYEKKMYKTMNGFYLGSVNALNIVVPFIGDYDFEAYDKNGELLSSMTIYEDDFLTETADTHAHAQVNFGLNMTLASGLEEGDLVESCRQNFMVEWGGGVSGIYYENKDAGLGAVCEKSNDAFVRDHSMTEIRVKPTNQADWFVIRLTKPMPYANRIKIVSLSKKETREYRCYDEFGDCEDEDFTTGGN